MHQKQKNLELKFIFLALSLYGARLIHFYNKDNA